MRNCQKSSSSSTRAQAPQVERLLIWQPENAEKKKKNSPSLKRLLFSQHLTFGWSVKSISCLHGAGDLTLVSNSSLTLPLHHVSHDSLHFRQVNLTTTPCLIQAFSWLRALTDTFHLLEKFYFLLCLPNTSTSLPSIP